MKSGIVILLSKIIDLFQKKSRSGDKKQELEEKKIDIYSKVLSLVLVTALLMCVLASLIPSLAITSWWFDLLERMIAYIQQ